jgi:hypothetical protein
LRVLREDENDGAEDVHAGDAPDSAPESEASSKTQGLRGISTTTSTTSSMIQEDKPGKDGENDKAMLCCVYFKHVSDNDTVVQCSHDDRQCKATAHAVCAGYTIRGASRAKFLCPSHKASKVMHSSRPKSHSGGKGAREKQLPPAAPRTNDTSVPCLCTGEDTCASCSSASADESSTPQGDNVALHDAFRLLTEKVQSLETSYKKENKELRMHILGLEDLIHSLEEEVKRLIANSLPAM